MPHGSPHICPSQSRSPVAERALSDPGSGSRTRASLPGPRSLARPSASQSSPSRRRCGRCRSESPAPAARQHSSSALRGQGVPTRRPRTFRVLFLHDLRVRNDALHLADRDRAEVELFADQRVIAAEMSKCAASAQRTGNCAYQLGARVPARALGVVRISQAVAGELELEELVPEPTHMPGAASVRRAPDAMLVTSSDNTAPAPPP